MGSNPTEGMMRKGLNLAKKAFSKVQKSSMGWKKKVKQRKTFLWMGSCQKEKNLSFFRGRKKKWKNPLLTVLRRKRRYRMIGSRWIPDREEKWKQSLPWYKKKYLLKKEEWKKKEKPYRFLRLSSFLNPVGISQVVVSQLVNAGLHLGGNQARWNPEMSMALLGVRHSLCLVDLSESVCYLRSGLSYLARSVRVKVPILFVTSEKGGHDYLSNRLVYLGHSSTRGRYIPGTISNYRSVGQVKEVPGVVCIGDSYFGVHAIRECARLQLPFFGLCDSEMDPRWFCFPVFGNNDGVEGMELLFGLVYETVMVADRKLKRRFLRVKGRKRFLQKTKEIRFLGREEPKRVGEVA